MHYTVTGGTKLKLSRRIVESFNCAIEGIIEVLRRENHMKVHFFVTVVVLLATLFLDISKIEIALLAGAIALVWITEIINTAIEAAVDIRIKEYHDLAKLAKDAGAGAVFIAVVNAVIIGYIVFYDKFETISMVMMKNVKNSEVNISIIALVLVVVLVVGLKAFFRKGRPLRGGMPSGHSAVAFSVWAAVFFMTDNVYITWITFFLAMLVAQTRVKAGIHSFKEVLVGGLIGGGLTFVIFFLLTLLGK